MEFDADGNPIAPTTAVVPPPVITDPPGGDPIQAGSDTPKPGTITLTPEELDARISSGVIAGLKEFQKQNAPAPKPDVTPPAQYDPARESFDMLRAYTRMNTEALDLYSDLPASYKEMIQDRLGTVAPDQIEGFRKEGLHKTVARDVMTIAMEEGKYVPTKFRPAQTTAAPRLEPVGGQQPTGQGGIPQSRASEYQEIADFFGLGKLDDAALRAMHTENMRSA